MVQLEEDVAAEVLDNSPAALVARLTRLLEVEELDTDLYRGMRLPEGRGRVFGGQVIAQALMAAHRSVDGDRAAHSLHAYFMRPGDEEYPIVYRVVRDYDGKSFATRRVIAQQRGVPILNMAASFQRPEQGLAHQFDMADLPDPDSLATEAQVFAADPTLPERARAWLMRPRAIEIRPVSPRSPVKPDKRAPHGAAWFRTVAPLSDDPLLHRAVLAYASDMTLLGTCTLPHGVNWLSHNLQMASIDHALWIHEDLRADDWLLYATDSPWTGHARGMNRGLVYTREGRLVASVAQEGLIRLRGEQPQA